MIVKNGHKWETLDDNMYVAINNRPKKIISIYKGSKQVYPTDDFYARPDSIVTKSGTILSENDGSRTPWVKKNNGKAAYLLTYQAQSNPEKNWITIIGISNKADKVDILETGSIYVLGTKEYKYKGKKYYLCTTGTNLEYGGATTYTNPLGLPELNGIRLLEENKFPNQEQFEIIATFLRIR